MASIIGLSELGRGLDSSKWIKEKKRYGKGLVDIPTYSVQIFGRIDKKNHRQFEKKLSKYFSPPLFFSLFQIINHEKCEMIREEDHEEEVIYFYRRT